MQKVVTELVDDIDGSPAVGTVRFGVDNTAYEIDLSEENAAELRAALAGYVESARPVGRFNAGTVGVRQQGSRPARADEGSERSEKVRAWAREQGIDVRDRGRIPRGVLAAYRAGHVG